MKSSDLKTSKFLKQTDIERPQVVTIVDITKENVALPGEPKREKGIAHFRELDRPMILNATAVNELETLFGSDVADWFNKRVELYVDPNVHFQGKKTGGLRLRAVPKPKPAGGSIYDDMPDDTHLIPGA